MSGPAAVADVATPSLMPVDSIQFVKELYPRIKEDDAAIERYRLALDKLPAIVVARGAVLVDGFHRWQAHRREGCTEIRAIDLGNMSDTEIFNESIRRNASHGQQLSAKDKAGLAAKLWTTTAHLPKAERYAFISEMLAVDERTVQRWTKGARTAEKDEQKARAWDLWLDCLSEQAIADAVGSPRQSVARWVAQNRQLSEMGNPPDPAVYSDLWSFQTDRDADKASYFGKTPRQLVDNLLWLYTEPGAVVVDPFAGSGTTIRAAKAMGRRVWSSDIVSSTPMLPIHLHDITSGWPKAAPKKADLVFLDPPYFLQAKGRYPEHEDQAGEIGDWAEWLEFWAKVVKSCKGRLKPGGHLAYIVSPTKVPGGKGETIDNATEMLSTCKASGFKMTRRYVVPYTTQQFSGDFVNKARENRDPLIQIRDLVVMS